MYPKGHKTTNSIVFLSGLFIEENSMAELIRLAINKLFYTTMGQLIVSVIFGLALAFVFRRVCTGDCTLYYAPHFDEVNDHIFKLEDTCYAYFPHMVDCEKYENILEPYSINDKPENKIGK
jgi:hypothetical protein